MVNELNMIETQKEFDVTPDALTELKRLFAQEESPENLFLRVGISPGGCSGFSYMMAFDDEKSDFDRRFDFDDIRVLIDEESLMYLQGAILDFKGSLMGGGFTFVNPNAKRSCGCGSSFRC